MLFLLCLVGVNEVWNGVVILGWCVDGVGLCLCVATVIPVGKDVKVDFYLDFIYDLAVVNVFVNVIVVMVMVMVVVVVVFSFCVGVLSCPRLDFL